MEPRFSPREGLLNAAAAFPLVFIVGMQVVAEASGDLRYLVPAALLALVFSALYYRHLRRYFPHGAPWVPKAAKVASWISVIVVVLMVATLSSASSGSRWSYWLLHALIVATVATLLGMLEQKFFERHRTSRASTSP